MWRCFPPSSSLRNTEYAFAVKESLTNRLTSQSKSGRCTQGLSTVRSCGRGSPSSGSRVRAAGRAGISIAPMFTDVLTKAAYMPAAKDSCILPDRRVHTSTQRWHHHHSAKRDGKSRNTDPSICTFTTACISNNAPKVLIWVISQTVYLCNFNCVFACVF